MALTGYVCLLSWALAVNLGGRETSSLASVDVMLRDLPRAAPIWLDAAPPDRLAPNIWMQAALRPALMEVWARSPTFREQVRAIGAHPKVHVAITLDPGLARDLRCRAQCEMRLFDSGLLIAHITLPGTAEAAELAAHELEHVRERLDGVNLRLEAYRHTPGVTKLADGRFESARAVAAGLRVRDEVVLATRALTRALTPARPGDTATESGVPAPASAAALTSQVATATARGTGTGRSRRP